MKRVAKLVATAIVTVAISAALVMVTLLVTGTLSYRVYAVRTGSMSPTIPSKSAVLVHKGDYHVGQVVAFRRVGGVITHRLMGINPDGSDTTKGDANTTLDPWTISRVGIIGGVVHSMPWLGYWLVYIKQPAGLGSIIAAIICLTCIWGAVGQQETIIPIPAPTPNN